MEMVVKAIGRKPPGAELMVAGDFNVEILAPEGRRAKNIATDLATAGVEDMAQNFIPRGRQWCRDRRTWDMKRQGQVVRSRIDYILGTDRRLFQNVAVRDPTTCPCLLMSPVRRSRHHRLPRGMKCCAMYLSPSVAKSVAMLSALCPSGSRMSAFRSPATSSSAPGGLRLIALPSRHVSAKIQAFCLASLGAVFGTALRRAAKSVSILDGATGGATGHRLRPPR